MPCRGIRGATTVDTNSPEAILSATRELLQALVAANGLDPADLAGAIFTVTSDLNAAFPAQAARELGWTYVPLLCAQEIDVPGALPGCIRVLLLWNTDKPPSEVVHVYLRGARSLRPDLAESYSQGRREP
ncbi:MAG: chorismate mutase [Anaerolineae bacterium]|nr:chorismate mutase [Anaerolineae bacterium]